ncbi:Rqc2 family fibronectin-binding protein [Bacillus piscicola]|uniref:Rqc2 family fibronectin-binding protein n=1 Tax=Bacillus piscicola TaxID=1632684 RepID=UPI001F097F31|nr:NFACT RNA binding domain-containing protein [Bacillus piscicola]
MSFDGIMTRAVVHECSQTLMNGRITKIKQPYQSDLLLTVRANRTNYQLLLSANPSFARVHLTNAKLDNPSEPPMFCMMLRKHLESGFIREIRQHGMERIITFVIEGKDEIGDTSTKHLVVEIMGKHSNILLVDPETNHILDSMKHIPPSVNRHRTILPGRDYVAPPEQGKADPLTADDDTVLRKLDMNQGKLGRQLVHAFTGLSPQTAEEIIHRAGIGNPRKIAETFTAVMQDIQKHHYEPQMRIAAGKEFYSVIDLTYVEGEKRTFATVSELLEHFFTGKAERDRVKQQAHDLERLLRNELAKNKKKIKKLEKTVQEADKRQEQQKFGELLTANLHLLKGGEKEIEVMDYYDEAGGTITIPLDPEKSPAENAQQFFRKYNKAKMSLKMGKEQINETNAEIRYLEQLIQQLDSASPADIAEIREELAEEGYVKKQPNKGKQKKKPGKPVLEHYQSSEGADILVGKNNKQNEYLTSRVAHKEDTWLHTKDIPGSHVVIRGEHVGDTTLKEAANIAAFYSKAKDSASVPVDYTKIKHVKKPNGAKPGFVTYDQQATVFVTPDEELVRKLRVREGAKYKNT